MKFKKLSLMGILFSSILSVTSCNPTSSSSSSSSNGDSSVLTLDTTLYTSEGNKKLSAEPDDDIINDMILDIVSKGASAMAGGIGTYGKTLVISLLKECGIDLRDATAKTLEKIQQQLSQIESKLNAIVDKMEKDHSEQVLSPLLKQIKETQFNYGKFSCVGIQQLADMENDDTIPEEALEQARLDYYNDAVKDLLSNGLPLASYVTNLANYILRPNDASGKSIFYYYFQTIASYDVWSIQRLKNVRSFIAYIDSVLFLTANLAKFQMYYLIQGKGAAAKATYESMLSTMATQVNQVNLLFKNQLESMKDYEDKMNNGLNIYLPTNKEYSTRLCTLTFDHYEQIEGDSRQGLLFGYDETHGKRYGEQNAYAYNADFTTVDGVANSFRSYASEYCTSDYTIQDYLTFCGFHANNQDLFEKSAGLYKGEMNVVNCGYINDDHDYYVGYYDNHCNYSRKKIYEVDTYHKWGFEIDYTEIKYLDNQYYLCFTTEDNGIQYIDGYYQRTYMNDFCYTVIDNAIVYKFDYFKINSSVEYQKPLRQVRDTW